MKERPAWCRRDDEEQLAMVPAEEFHQRRGSNPVGAGSVSKV
jgi:hypothetical protein